MDFWLELKTWVKILVKVKSKNFIGKYSRKFLDFAKQSATDALKTFSKRVTQKTAETTDDLIGNKITNKITGVSKN